MGTRNERAAEWQKDRGIKARNRQLGIGKSNKDMAPGAEKLRVKKEEGNKQNVETEGDDDDLKMEMMMQDP